MNSSAGGDLARRHGKASVLTTRNPRYLNAEDEATLPGMETAVDLALLDPKTEVQTFAMISEEISRGDAGLYRAMWRNR